jgi:hypothetical protein
LKKLYSIKGGKILETFHEKKGYDKFIMGGLQANIVTAFALIRKKDIVRVYDFEIYDAVNQYVHHVFTPEYIQSVATDPTVNISVPIVLCKFNVQSYDEHNNKTELYCGQEWPIDGWRRICKAVSIGLTHVPAIVLSMGDSRRVIDYEGAVFMKPTKSKD